MRSLYSLLFLVTLCLNLSQTHAVSAQQISPREATLAMVLKTLSIRYQVNFVYEDQSLDGKKLSDELNLLREKLLDHILLPLGLAWFNIDGKNYAIYPIGKARERMPVALSDTIKQADITGV